MKLSSRATDVQASPIRKLMPYAIAAKKKGLKIYHLNIGQPDIETPAKMIDVYHNYSDKVLAYGPSQGLESYREKLVEYYSRYKINLETEDILVTTAGSEAIVFAMLVTCNPGDELIIPEPFYTNYNGFATMTGIKIRAITTYAEDGFQLPASEKFEELINAKTRAIMLCNPGNPTGAVYTKEDLERIAELAIKHNLYVIADEVYREFVYDGYSHTSILAFPKIADRAIMVDSISKRYSACGARIGCIISKNKELIASALKFAQARLCPPTLEQLSATAAIDLQEDYFNEVLGEYDKRRRLVFEELQKIEDVVCVIPKGAFYIVAKLPIEDAEDFARWMLEEFDHQAETVMFAPAQGFYATPNMGRNELRIAYILNETDLKKAMQILREGLTEYKKLK
ncbi:MAG: pyridoxal phosphate-dependent aminotransferase [Candidatus Cloacimonetes bacterium]|nr:pyridoxal phosphate-dependent aminotransferase [Candidatus Cloacimonadota bacterium]MCF7813390.1 pyridoxal phosphate-dependent aminotransferase [Candidatus Cloacimonadota bacterium]MCF7867485.1 pyridoxal phosphate-dependent aminotransferase [Candidatus Cloacimonadota bacterium]MCF7883012.1 pyridoxal phosphate-dependent aminotransferase [Candidatus Cloacimonadota bacterium]